MKKYKGYEYPTTIAELEKYGGLKEAKIDIDGVDVVINVEGNVKDPTDSAVELYVGCIIKEYVDNYLNSVDNVLNGFDGVKEVNENIQALKKKMEEKANRPENKIKSLVNNIEKMHPNDTTEGSTFADRIKSKNIAIDEEKIAQELEDVNKDNPEIQAIKELPSNNGKTERSPEEIDETGEMKMVNVEVDPNTGENKIINSKELDDLEDDDDDEESFDKLLDKLNDSDFDSIEDKPISAEDAISFLTKDKGAKLGKSMISDIAKDTDISEESIKNILEIANRRMAKEDFNVYKEFSNEIKSLIDGYLAKIGIGILDQSVEAKTMRNSVSEALIDDFIANVNYDRIKQDFNKEVENIFNKGGKEIAKDIVGYTKAKNKAYRDAAENIDDPVKKQKLIDVLDSIDEGYNLTGLKEFSKKCKIKKFDLEKPNKIFDEFKLKYKDSSYNIYDINMARPILYRALNANDPDMYNDKDVNAFFIAFCKQTVNYKETDVIEHAYMYYFMYNIVLYDLNAKLEDGDSEFISNVKEVIDNLRMRNQY